MRYVDFHMHTSASEDSEAPVRAMLDASAALGLEAVAITDHAEMLGYREGGYDLTLKQSWRESGEVQPEYTGRLRIARGIELGEPLADGRRANEFCGIMRLILCSVRCTSWTIPTIISMITPTGISDWRWIGISTLFTT